MVCCSGSCEKCTKCGRYIHNLSTKYREGVHTVEALASFGHGFISTGKCESHYMCGPNGNYAMYEPIEIDEIKISKPAYAIATAFTHGAWVEEKGVTAKTPLSYQVDCDVDIDEFFRFLQKHVPSGKVLQLYTLLRKDFEKALFNNLQNNIDYSREVNTHEMVD